MLLLRGVELALLLRDLRVGKRRGVASVLWLSRSSSANASSSRLSRRSDGARARIERASRDHARETRIRVVQPLLRASTRCVPRARFIASRRSRDEFATLARHVTRDARACGPFTHLRVIDKLSISRSRRHRHRGCATVCDDRRSSVAMLWISVRGTSTRDADGSGGERRSGRGARSVVILYCIL